MNPGNDQGNYDSGNSGFGNYGPEGYAGNGYDANNGESETPYFDDFKRARRWYNWGVSTGIGAMSAKLGFRITQRGNKNIITGPRDVKGRWQKSWTGKKLSRWNNGFSNKVGNTLEKVYDDHRGFKGTHTWFGKSTKNVVQKHMKMGAAAKSGLKGTFGKGALKISTNLKGSGLVGAFATFGLDLWKYNPWSGGVKSDVGYANTDFASAVITDAGIAAGTTIVSSAAGAGAAAMAGAMYGSVIPGLGTAVGAAVGLGIGIFMTTDLGRNIRKWVKGGVKSVLDKGVEAAKDAWKKTKDIANKVGDTVQGAWDWATGLF